MQAVVATVSPEALAAVAHTPLPVAMVGAVGSIIVTIAIVALVVAGLLAPLWLRMRDRARLYDLLRHSHDHGQPISPELIGQMMAGPTPTWDKDIRRGAVLLAIAVGLGAPLVALSGGAHTAAAAMPVWMAVCVCACLGVTFLALGLLRRPGKS